MCDKLGSNPALISSEACLLGESGVPWKGFAGEKIAVSTLHCNKVAAQDRDWEAQNAHVTNLPGWGGVEGE